MKTTITNSSILQNSNLRLDAGYHLSEGQLTLSAFEHHKIPTLSLSSVTGRIFYGGRSRRIYVKNHAYGLPFIKGADIIKSDFSSLSYISKKRTANLHEYFLQEGWTVLTRSGTIGNTAFVTKDFLGKAASDDIIRVVPKSILPGFLYAFLSSKYGKSLLTHGTYGAVIQHIEPEHIENIPIPIFPTDKQQQIHDLIIQSAELRVEANRLLEEAENLLLDFLRISKVRYRKFQVLNRNIKDIINSFQKRIDAPAFINEGVNTIENLKYSGFTFQSLKNCEAKVTRPGIFKRVYVKYNGLPYIKGSELGLNNPFANCVYLSKSKTPFLNELKLRNNQILITCAGSVGDLRLITKEFEELNAIGSQDIIRIECKENRLLTTNYIFAYLRLPFVYEFIQSLKYGSVIERIEPFHVDSIPVLVPNEELSKEVSDRISRYKENIYTAFKKESQAIELVEKEIDLWQN